MGESLLSDFLAAGLSIELDGEELVVSGLRDLPEAEAARVVDRIKAKKATIVADLKQRNDTRPGYSCVAAREFIELCNMGMATLFTTGNGDLWPGLPEKYDDAGSWSFLNTIWMESFELLFLWLKDGVLDQFLNGRSFDNALPDDKGPVVDPGPKAAKLITPRQEQMKLMNMAAVAGAQEK